jgi:LuxR family maltose regulon positive regulatory protein
MVAQDDGDRLPLRVSATLACLTATARTDPPSEAFLARVDGAAALVAELPAEGPARRECAAVITGLRAVAALGTDAPTGQLLTGLRAAAAAAQTAASRRLRGRAVGCLAMLEALEGNLTRAAQLAGEAEALAAEEAEDDVAREPAAATALAWVHLRRYSLVEAREWLGRARARERAAGPSAVGQAAVDAVLQSQLFRLRHDHDSAERALKPHLQGPQLPQWVAEHVVTEVVRFAIARGHVQESLRVLDDRPWDEAWSRRLQATVGLLAGDQATHTLLEAEPAASPAVAVESAVIRACQLLTAGHATAASDELSTALALARPELMRWPFVDSPPQARRLLRTHPRLQDAGAWLNPSNGARPHPGGVSAPAVTKAPEPVQQLSDREIEVLRYLGEMLSTAEIAATMFISVNTVRTHIRSILRKLAVSRRNQAVRRARELGLL